LRTSLRSIPERPCTREAGTAADGHVRKALMTVVFRIVTWVSVIVIALGSLVPGDVRPHSGLPPQVEHFLAYAAAAGLLALTSKGNLARLWRLALLFAVAAVCEVCQIWIPDRNSQLSDVIASSAGAWLGMTVSVL